DGPSYTIDTLMSFREEIGAHRQLVLLLGADAFGGLPSWHRWHELFALAHIGVLTRPGQTLPLPVELNEEIAQRLAASADELWTSASGRVLRITITPLEISATRIRAQLRAGRGEPRWLVPDALLADPALLAPYRGT
ncbi:MAG: nicotinic acid mononucleotide adenylyltransferase, partial [Pseudomonadota bacterium]|nr:nicotinic acid mononucleotide adenylyltransferase [Pseudomonadota bacterium]